MIRKEVLFVYGTLMDPEIRRDAVGRVVNATIPDTLLGYEKSEIDLAGEPYPVITPHSSGVVNGLVFEVTPEELKRLDEYEDDMYQRIMVTLNSGTSAWVYAKRQ